MLFNIISFPLFLEFPLLSLLNYKDIMSLIFMTLFIIRTKLLGAFEERTVTEF